MNETNIRKYASLMEELGLTGLEITEDSCKVRLERSAPAPAKGTAALLSTPGPDTGVAAEDGDIPITSPMVGMFYAAPAENADPYVVAGDRVKKGQTLCIIEALKLMNEITAEEDGIISKVCAANGQVVEYGTELFRLRR